MSEENTEQNWPSIEVQAAYWRGKDRLLSQTEATCDWYDRQIRSESEAIQAYEMQQEDEREMLYGDDE